MNHGIARIFLAATAVWLTGVSQQAALAAPNAIEIVRSGNLTPSMDGRFQSFLEPSINARGTLVFNARLFDTDDDNLDDSGIYRFFSPAPAEVPVITTLQEVFREGDAYAVGGSDFSIADVFLTASVLQDTPNFDLVSPVAGQFSALAVRLVVSSGNPNGNSIIAVEDDQGAWDLVVAAGDEVPGGDGTFGELSNFALSGITQNSGVSFGTGLDNTPGGSDDNVGLFRYLADGSLQELVRKGTPSTAGTFASVGGLRSNDIAGVAFSAVDDSGDTANDTAIYRVSALSSGLIRVVGKGDDAPSDDPDARVFAAVTEHRVNNEDNVGFAGRLRDAVTGFAVQDGSGLYRASSTGVVSEIVREGQLIPDGSARFSRFASSFSGDVPRSPFNDLDQFAFVVGLNLEGGSGQSSGLFRASVDEVVQVALEGDNYEDGTFLAFRRDPALNNQGLVAFDVELNVGEGVGGEGPFFITSQVLVLTNGEDFATVARESEQIGSRTIQEIFFNNNPLGPANGLNDNGGVAFEVRYEDGSSAIIRWRPQIGWQAASGDGAWDDPDNWFFDLPPNIESNVEIDTATDSNVTGPGSDTTVYTLTFGNASGQVTLTSNGGAIATVDGLTIGPNGTLAVADDSSMTLTGSVVSNGEIQLGDNGQLTVAGAYSGTGPITGAGGTVLFQGAVAPGAAPD